MGDCNETLKELERFLDGEVPGQTRESIQNHLDGCLDCLSAYDFHAELRLIIAKKCREQSVPPGLLAKVKDCLGMEASGPAPSA